MALEGMESPVLERQGTVPCKEANEALQYAIIGIFCFGMVLGPMAISKGNAAKRIIGSDPALTGIGKANAAVILGWVVFVFWILGFLSKIFRT
jgi:hypothetical protein